MNEKLGIVIVTFNPDEKDSIKEKIEQYKRASSLTVIIDNASDKPIDYFADDKVVLIQNIENYGHAKALNIGCSYLYEKGFSHVLLLGQDSRIDNESIERLFDVAKNSEYAMVGPQINASLKDKGEYLIRTKHWFNKEIVNEDEIKEVYINITSGSTLSLSAWKAVGGFWDDLFIEKVDDEFALRLRKFGYKIAVVGNAYLTEPYGNSKIVKKFGMVWHPTFHKAWRLFLLYRNKIYVSREYMKSEFPFVVFQNLSLLKRAITIVAVEDNKQEKIKSIIKGGVYGLTHRIQRGDYCS